MDNFLPAAVNPADVNAILEILRTKYMVKYMKAPTTSLSWTIANDQNGHMHVSQATLISKIIQTASIPRESSRSTPLSKRPDFDEDNISLALYPPEKLKYTALLRDLGYLADCTRLYITFSVVRLAENTVIPKRWYIELLIHALKYFQGMIFHGVHFSGQKTQDVIIFADADDA